MNKDTLDIIHLIYLAMKETIVATMIALAIIFINKDKRP